MIKLGVFIKDRFGILNGLISGLDVAALSVISDQGMGIDGKPYLKLIADPLGDAYEIGAAFPQIKGGLLFYTVYLELPACPNPVSATLVPNKEIEGAFNLICNRPDI